MISNPSAVISGEAARSTRKFVTIRSDARNACRIGSISICLRARTRTRFPTRSGSFSGSSETCRYPLGSSVKLSNVETFTGSATR